MKNDIEIDHSLHFKPLALSQDGSTEIKGFSDVV